MRRHNVMLVNGYHLSRYALKHLLEATGEFTVTEAVSSLEALASQKNSPDLFLIDISDPGKNGLETLCDLKHDFPHVPCLIVGGPRDDTLHMHYERLGCSTYIARDASENAIWQAASALLNRKPVSAPLHLGKDTQSAKHLPHIHLSTRERQVFFKLTSGKSIRSVARELLISASSVSVFRCKIMRKMHCTTNAELISYALRHRLLTM